MTQLTAEFSSKFKSLNSSDKEEYLKKLSPKEIELLYDIPELFLRENQIITGNQRYTILMCGRGFGKTFAGSYWVANKVRNGAENIGIVAATFGDLETVMVPALLSWFKPGDAKYVGGAKKTITFKNYPKITIYCYSSDQEIRGPNLSYAWLDELCKFSDSIPEKIEEQFNVMDFAVRIGKHPQILVTTTPKPFPILFRWQDRFIEGDTNYLIKTGTLFDNTALPESFREAMAKEFGKTRLGLQELQGVLLRDVPGAAFTYEMIECDRVTLKQLEEKLTETITKVSETGHITYHKPVELVRTITSVDPSVTDSHDCDEVGIITAALTSDGHIYILQDWSGQYTTNEWAIRTVEAYKKYGGSVVIEKNQGGELVKKNIQNICTIVPIKTITTTKGKLDRAFLISALYEQHLVHHVGRFLELEKQMTRYDGSSKQPSPGRLDALCFACQDLKLNHIGLTERHLSPLGYF